LQGRPILSIHVPAVLGFFEAEGFGYGVGWVHGGLRVGLGEGNWTGVGIEYLETEMERDR
jgi:hypothetical protein